jgi:hypothetical protein
MTPRAQALAYRIWAFAEPKGWDCTVGEIAEALGVGNRAVSHMAEVKGWAIRLRGRKSGLDYVMGHRPPGFDESILGGERISAVTAHYVRLADEAAE